MCLDPASLMIMSAVIGGVGQVTQGMAARDAANYEARIQARNAEVADANAKDARERGQLAEDQQRRETRGLLSQQRVIFADRNISSASGTPLEVLGDTAQFGELDALTVRSNFEREAIGFENQAGGFRANAQMSKASGRNAMIAGTLGAVSEGIGGFTQVQKYRANRRLSVI